MTRGRGDDLVPPLQKKYCEVLSWAVISEHQPSGGQEPGESFYVGGE